MDEALKKLSPSVWVLALTTFLVTIFGGYIAMDPPMPSTGIGGLVGPEGAATNHALFGMVVAILALALIYRRRVIQFPAPALTLVLFVFAGTLVMSVGFSKYPIVSISSLGEWLTYVLATFVAVALAGRRLGSRVLIGAGALGATVVALRGLNEYATASDPSWRIFAGWVHPNAAAAVLLAGLGMSLALYQDQRRPAWLLPAFLCGSALTLTQSKGGLLAEAVLVFALIVAAIFTRRYKELALTLVVIFLAFGFATLLQKQMTAKLAPKSVAVNRVFNASSNREQSAGFRQNLWKGSGQLIKTNPVGRGIGTYRYHSAEPGITPQTQLAHNSFLQIGVEAGVLALIAITVLLLWWSREALKGIRQTDDPNLVLRLGVFAVVLSLAAHSVVDSDLYQFGIGFLMFLLIGVGFQLSSDAIAPEFVGKLGRGLAGALAGAVVLCSVVSISTESALSGFMARLQAQAVTPGEKLDGLSDHRSAYLEAMVASNRSERIDLLQESIESGPTPRAYRALARELSAEGRASSAAAALDGALRLDPNNLTALWQKLEILAESGDESAASAVATRLIEVEQTPYFEVRALPELVPTETFKARVFLAERSANNKAKANLLKPAVEGYIQFARRTVPQVKQAELGGAGVPGITGEDCRKVISEARRALALLAQTQSDEAFLAEAKGALNDTGF